MAMYDMTGSPINERLVHYLYMIGEPTGPVKLGRAENPEKRLGEIQVGNPNDLHILRTRALRNKRQAVRAEQHLHDKCKEYRIRGEWYREEVKAEWDDFMEWDLMLHWLCGNLE